MNSKGDQSKKLLPSLDDEFFVEAIERKLNTKCDKFALKVLSIEPTTGSNENFVSSLYRVKIGIDMIHSKEKMIVSVIVKIVLEDDISVDFNVFAREVLMYENLIESFEEIWKKATGVEANFGPKLLKVAVAPLKVIVLEDLCAEGFKMIDKKIGMNLEQAKLVLSKLAKFHAASAIRYESDGSISEKFDRVLDFNIENPSAQRDQRVMFFQRLFKLLIEAAASFGYSDVAEKISQWDFLKIILSYVTVSEPMACGFQVLNHGDVWSPNVMLYTDFDARFVDFQLSHWGSPCGDLRYFLITSLADDIKVEHFDDLILFYHEELEQNLKTLNYQKRIPTLAELHIDMLEKGTPLPFCLMFTLCFAKIDGIEALSMEKILDPEKFSVDDLRKLFMSDANLKALKVWLPFLNKRGFLDALLPDAPNTDLVTELLRRLMQAMALRQKSSGNK